MTSNANSISPTPKGVIFPVSKPMPAGNPNASAFQAGQTKMQNQVTLTAHATGAISGGGKFIVPQHQMQYTVTNSTKQGVNATSTHNTAVMAQAEQNRKYDHYALQNGGKKKRGGYSKLAWGCYSGGRKSRKTRKSRKSRKTRKSTK